jgi:hypothetical protein
MSQTSGWHPQTCFGGVENAYKHAKKFHLMQALADKSVFYGFFNSFVKIEYESVIRIRERLFRADEMRGGRRVLFCRGGARPYCKMMGGAHKFICA